MSDYPVIGGVRSPSVGRSVEGEYEAHDPVLDEIVRKFRNNELLIVGRAQFIITSVNARQDYTDYYDSNLVLHRYPGLKSVTVTMEFVGEVRRTDGGSEDKEIACLTVLDRSPPSSG